MEEVAKKIARNHYNKGIREPLNYKLMTNTILDYIKVRLFTVDVNESFSLQK